MATSAISQNHVDLLHTPISGDEYGGSFADFPESDGQNSTSASLGAPRAIMAALGFEAGLIVCACFAWGLWHMLR